MNKQQPEALAELRERLRSFEADHTPDGWPAVRMRDITALLDDLDNARSDNQVLRLGYAAARLEIESLKAQAVPDLSALTERGAKAWAGVDAQWLRDGVASPSANAGEPSAHIKEPYTLAEIKAKIASNDYSAEMLLQHAMLLLDSASISAQAGAPANMKVTERMRDAGDYAWMTADRLDSARVFRAMLAAAPANPDPAYSAACNLATALFKKYFAHLPDFESGQAVWGLCGSTAGVISQIDNMVSGLLQPHTTAFSEDELE